MTDAKLYVDRVHMAVGSDLASSVGPIVFGRDMHGASPSPQPKAGKPDPFGQTSKVRAAMDAHPAHLAGSRWPVERVATDFAFRLEQIGTSLETCTRNLARLCTSLKIGVVDEDKVVAIAPADVQRIAAVWGIVIDKAQVRELFALRKLDPGAPVPISIFVRRFTESVSAIGGVLDRSLPRSTTRAPPIDYGGGSGPYSGGKPNAVEEARSQSYKTIGARHLATYKVRRPQLEQTAARGARSAPHHLSCAVRLACPPSPPPPATHRPTMLIILTRPFSLPPVSARFRRPRASRSRSARPRSCQTWTQSCPSCTRGWSSAG